MGCGSSSAYRNSSSLSRPATTQLMALNTKSSIEITNEALQQYLDLEQSIREQERRNILENFQIKTEQLEQLEQSVQQLQEILVESQQEAIIFQRKMGYDDLKNVKEFILRKSYTNDPLTKDEEMFLDSLNREEIVEREINNAIVEIESLKIEVSKLTKESETLQHLYSKRDELLDKIFEGQYGSDLENQLERELDWLLEQKHHVDQAYFRWRQAQMSAKSACSKLASSIQKWKEILSIPAEDNERKYETVTEIRNSLSEACQGLSSAQRYLPNITFPYCSADEVETLEKAIAFIFTDMQSRERHEHALNCYQTTYKRSAALKQWLDQVLNSTISKDLYEITEDCKARAAELRNERTRLIRHKIREITGHDLESNGTNSHELRDSGVDSELDDTSTMDEQIARIFEMSRNDRKGGSTSLTPDPTKMPMGFPTPLPSADLAPLPQKEEIFGKIEFLRNKHKREIMEFQRTQKLNQVRVAQGLKEKLQQRRSRRSRMQMHNRELEALRETP